MCIKSSKLVVIKAFHWRNFVRRFLWWDVRLHMAWHLSTVRKNSRKWILYEYWADKTRHVNTITNTAVTVIIENEETASAWLRARVVITSVSLRWIERECQRVLLAQSLRLSRDKTGCARRHTGGRHDSYKTFSTTANFCHSPCTTTDFFYICTTHSDSFSCVIVHHRQVIWAKLMRRARALAVPVRNFAGCLFYPAISTQYSLCVPRSRKSQNH